MLSSFGKTKLLESQVDQFLDLITKGTLCMREAIRSYLGGDDEDFQSRLRDCTAKVEFYEKEVDHACLRLKKMIYASEMELARKHHLRYFADSLASLSDIAEAVGDHLLIASIKRSA